MATVGFLTPMMTPMYDADSGKKTARNDVGIDMTLSWNKDSEGMFQATLEMTENGVLLCVMHYRNNDIVGIDNYHKDGRKEVITMSNGDVANVTWYVNGMLVVAT